jgi:hypothetical protein
MMPDEADSLLLLYGTTQPVAPPRVLQAGPLTAEFEAGNLRYIRYAGFEMIRAISFLVRGQVWNTFAPEIADLTVREDGDAFRVRYTATIRDGAATLSYRARIDGTANGALSFTAEGHAETDFVTCRAGFVVLHPIVGVAGHDVEIERVDGRIEHGQFPALIDPVQPMRDLRALTHGFAPGARVTCRMEGDTFEMEDQRNWTDASYKTYVRPLALPWPYTLQAGAPLRQSISLRLHGRPTESAGADDLVRIEIGGALGPMPGIALGCTPAEAGAALPHATRLTQAGIAALVCRIDPRDGAPLAPVRDLATALGVEVELQLVVPSVEAFTKDIEDSAAQLRSAGLHPAAVAVSPAADLKSTPPGSVWPPCPPAEAVLRAARAAFPGARLGGGMLSTFTELNRKRPPLDLIDFVTFCTTPNVHAGDDRSIMETLESLPAIAASMQAIVGDKPWVVGPSSIGMRDNPYGAAPLPNPDGVRMAMAGRDPRQASLFNAAWTLGYIARFAAGGAQRIAVSAPVGDFGILGAEGPCPVFHVIAGLARLRGATLHAAESSRPRDVLALLTKHELWLANLTPAPVRVAIPAPFSGSGATATMLDAACGPAWTAMRPVSTPDAPMILAPFAVAALRDGG